MNTRKNTRVFGMCGVSHSIKKPKKSLRKKLAKKRGEKLQILERKAQFSTKSLRRGMACFCLKHHESERKKIQREPIADTKGPLKENKIGHH